MDKHRNVALILGVVTVGLLLVPATPAQAHGLCSNVTGYANRTGSGGEINGKYRVFNCSTGTTSAPEDGWFECWLVHRHHWGTTWWWHSHPGAGAKDTGTDPEQWWGWKDYNLPDTRGLKSHCEYEGLHGNWWKEEGESSTV